ncbi:hypothetical protein [Pseudomonas soli]|uniref:hypothetical protein n=1 Tax=Pseudomonas soli TaxID=1306993 RepID=UPI0028AD2B2B|nr:hypothetical protein [Pseudomonas soli]
MSFSSEHQAAMKQQGRKGRCLHFENGVRCNKIILAHSIQKQGQLSLIAESGHVYRLSADLSALKTSGGKPQLRKVGLNRASTFPGMCGQHDNELFSPIDNSPLTGSREQVALYAYRSICREFFVKENASITLNKMVGSPGLDWSQQQLLRSAAWGQTVGFQRLKRHKGIYDECLAAKDFSGFKFVIFESGSKFSFQTSGLIFPDYDFLGRQLQDLGPQTKELDLLTFFTAPTIEGWAFVFAWHESSAKSCSWFIQSLAELVRTGAKAEDALLRFGLVCCENHEIRISWWDGLSSALKKQAMDAMVLMADPTVGVEPDYLVSGCEGLADWSFDGVRDVT